MRKTSLLVLGLLLASCGDEPAAPAPVTTTTAPVQKGPVQKTRFYDEARTQKAEQGTEVDGLRQGVWREWYPEGPLSAEGAYKDGLKDGAWKLLWPDGSVKGELTFVAGKREGTARSATPTVACSPRARSSATRRAASG